MIEDLCKKHYKFAIDKLGGDIDPSSSTCKIKKSYLLLKLKKRSPNRWESINFVKKFNPTQNMDKKEDPSVGLMKMMKRMYDEGDDKMKRTISEAFTKANE